MTFLSEPLGKFSSNSLLSILACFVFSFFIHQLYYSTTKPKLPAKNKNLTELMVLYKESQLLYILAHKIYSTSEYNRILVSKYKIRFQTFFGGTSSCPHLSFWCHTHHTKPGPNSKTYLSLEQHSTHQNKPKINPGATLFTPSKSNIQSCVSFLGESSKYSRASLLDHIVHILSSS